MGSEEEDEDEDGEGDENGKEVKTKSQQSKVKKSPKEGAKTKSKNALKAFNTAMDNASEKANGVASAPDEYEDYDSSDEEEIRNTVGNIPMEWYKDYEHIGYDLDGQKIIKPQQMDELDEFLDKMDNPDYWRTVRDKLTGNVLDERME